MSKPVAFVVMPFSSEFNAVYEGLIIPALDGYDVIRADTQFDQRSILEKIISGISDASLVVADITAMNPNVMYELGIAHTLGRPVIMITQNIDDLPFDISVYPVHEYSTHFQRAGDLAQKLSELGARHRQGLVKFASPVADFLGSAPAVRTPPPPATRDGGDSASLSEEPGGGVIESTAESLSTYGYLDFSADLEEHGGAALVQMQRLNALTSGLTTRMRELAPLIKAAREASTPGSASRVRSLTNELALEFQTYARVIKNDIIPRFRGGWERVGQSLLWLLEHQDAARPMTEDFRPLFENVFTLHEVLTSNVESMAEVRKLFPMMRGQTSELTRAAEEAERALTQLMGEYTVATSYLSKIDEHLRQSREAASGLTSTPPGP